MTIHFSLPYRHICVGLISFTVLATTWACDSLPGRESTRGPGDSQNDDNPIARRDAGGDSAQDGGAAPVDDDGDRDGGTWPTDHDGGAVEQPPGMDAQVPAEPDAALPEDPGYVRVQAEDFLPGVEGYFDTTPENQGGYGDLSEGVDVGIAFDSEAPGSRVVGYTRPGEWLRYAFVLEETSHYTLRARVSHAEGGGQFSVYVDDRLVMRFVVPSTGSWDSFTWIDQAIGALEAGEHSMKVTVDSAGLNGADAGNLNFFDFVPGAADGGLAQWDAGEDAGGDSLDVVRVETEDFVPGPDGYHDTTPENQGGAGSLAEGVDVGFSGDPETPGSLAIGYTQAGEWLLYDLVLTRTAEYALRARVAHATGGGTFSVHVDGEPRASFTIPSTGAWENWTTLEQPLGRLSAGAHTLRLSVDTAGLNFTDAGNVNYLEFVPGPALDADDGGVATDGGSSTSDAGIEPIDAGASRDAGADTSDAGMAEDAGDSAGDAGATGLDGGDG